MSQNDGSTAFPRPASRDAFQPYQTQPAESHSQNGMSLRDWFAGQVLAGLSAFRGGGCGLEDVAKEAYDTADLMLKIREIKQQPTKNEK